MSEHSNAAFNHSCLKTPRNPMSKKPYPIYDQKLVGQLTNQTEKLSITNGTGDKKPIKSFLEFFDSIPEYDEINHLSNKEFYKRLDFIKEQKRLYLEYLQNEIKYSQKGAWLDDYKAFNLSHTKSEQKPFCSTSIKQKPTENLPSCDDVESITSTIVDKEKSNAKSSSRRSVRIESPPEKNTPSELEYFRPKSRAHSKDHKASSPCNDSIFGDVSDIDTLTTKSAPSSPRKTTIGWKDNEFEVDKHFQMTVRDENDKLIDEYPGKCKKPIQGDKSEMFRANPVPIESQIPLFDKIMLDQKIRSQKVKCRSKAALKAQMRPFSFTRRDEEWQAITSRLSKSSPNLFTAHEKPAKQFKAKPVPKNLFSNYVYKKMHEDEFYRALQKKIRSEEMLKAASLPPAMAKREKQMKDKCDKFEFCPRSYRDFNIDVSSKHDDDNLDKKLAELELDFILATPSPKPHKTKTKNKTKKKLKRIRSKSSSSSRESFRSNSALGSVNRSNLAAVLRIETARKKLENEMSVRLEEQRCKEEARWREKIFRRRPVWQSLQYSHEEDLKMRLQLRRDEECLRREEHKLEMQTMLGRVNQQPTLFERQSQNKIRSTKSKDDFITKLYKNMSSSSSTSSSKVSSCTDAECKNLIEMKDEAIQAVFDDN